jgi:SAM-dependent methyltransferase
MKKVTAKPEHYSFTRYLEVKAEIDNQALNQRVWAKLLEFLSNKEDLRIIEIGAGIGTMLERILSANLLRQASYTALDISPENLSIARTRIADWALNKNVKVNEISNNCFLLERHRQVVSVKLRSADVLDYVEQSKNWKEYDLVIANAFLDLIDIPYLLPRLFRLLDQSGLFYLTINYDGLTILEPPINDDLDHQILKLYNETMDYRTRRGLPSGDSQSGRHLFHQIQNAGGRILAAGSSDWVLYPGEKGYTEDETYFLHFIIHTIFMALENHSQINFMAFEEWINKRHEQIDSSELVYIAHQIDFLGQIP